MTLCSVFLQKTGDKKNKKEELRQVVSNNKFVEREDISNMENLLGLSKRSRDKQRKGKDSVDSSLGKDDRNKEKRDVRSKEKKHHDKNKEKKEDENKEKKPEALAKVVKKREKLIARNKKNKTLSVEEELLLKSLNDWYENIDKNVPEDKLTEEQKVIKKLKSLYEDDSLKEKPVAHKPKNLLAISKPLLDSVFLNPKLEEIVKDPNMPIIEEVENYDSLMECGPPEMRPLPEVPGRSAVRSVDFTKFKEQKKSSIIGRSKSCDDLHALDEKYHSPVLYRSTETEDLRKDVTLVRVERESSIRPSDSVSNPRYSHFAITMDSNLKQKHTEENWEAAKLTGNDPTNIETLESILAALPKDVPENQLTREQRFALRLKKVLDEAERKNTLKKIRKPRKQIDISSPTADSVERNTKLRDILLDPQIQSVRRNSETDNKEGLHFKDPIRQSKSYQDISFSFNVKSDSDNKSLDSTHSTVGDSYGFNKKNSMTETFSSTELDGDANLLSTHDLKNLTSFKENDAKSADDIEMVSNDRDRFQFPQENPDQDLLYNETFNKKNQSTNKGKVLQDAQQMHSSGYYNKDKTYGLEARKFKVKSLEEKYVGKNHIATVVTPEDYIVLLDDSHHKNQSTYVTDTALSRFKVQNVEEHNIGKIHTATVVTPEEYVLVLDDPHHQSNPEPLKVTEEGGIGNVNITTVDTPEEYVSILEDNDGLPILTNSETPKFKVRYLDEADSVHTATVITPTNHSAVLDVTHDKENFSSVANKDAPKFKVRYVDEDEIGKINTTTVIMPEEHSAVLSVARDEKRISDLTNNENFVVETPEDEVGKNHYLTVLKDLHHEDKLFDSLPIFKVEPDEDEIDRNRTATVVLPEEHTIVLDNSHVKNQISDFTDGKSVDFGVESPDDEIVYSEKYVVVLDDSELKDLEDLTYIDTLNRKLVCRGERILEEFTDSENIGNSGRTSDIPDIIIDSSKLPIVTFTENRDSSVRDSLNYEDGSWEVVDQGDEESPGYDYHAILKENRYGVVSPLNIRLTYKDVVKEIKTKFAPIESDTSDLEDDIIAERDTFFDEFFGTKRMKEGPQTDEATSSNGDDIDEEMEEIFVKYLQTPVSKIITQIGNKRDDDFETDDFKELHSIEDQKLDEDKVTSATNFAILAGEDGPEQEKVENNEDFCDFSKGKLSEDDTEIMKTPSGDQNMIADKTLSPDSDTEFVFIRNKQQAHQIAGSVNKNLSLISNNDSTVKQLEKVNTDETDNLSEEELSLLRSLRNVRYSRPLSDFNDKDLRMVKELSTRYLSIPKTPTLSDIDKKSVENSSDCSKTITQTETEDVEKITKEVDEKNILPPIHIIVIPPNQLPCEKGDEDTDIRSKTKHNGNEFEYIAREFEEPKLIQIIDVESPINISIITDEGGRIFKENEDDTKTVEPKFEEIHQEERSFSGGKKPNTEHSGDIPDLVRLPQILPIVMEKQEIKEKESPCEDRLSVPTPAQPHNRITTKSKHDDDDDLNMILAKMSAPNSTSRRRMERYPVKDVEYKDGKPKIILRNTSYEGVKSKLEFFSKFTTEETQQKRQSLNLHSNVATDRRKVKSWAEQFKKKSLDTHSSYEPVYANLESLNLPKNNSVVTTKIEKKPLPVPRSKNLDSFSVKNSDRSDAKDDVSIDEPKMSDCKIISENDTENLNQEHPGSDFNNIGKIKVPDIPVYSETSKVMLEGSPKIDEKVEDLKSGVLRIKKSEKFLEMQGGSSENVGTKDEPENSATGVSTDFLFQRYTKISFHQSN